MAKIEFSQEYLKGKYEYDPITGNFYTYTTKGKKLATGHYNELGYQILSIYGDHYRAHRLAWLYVHGVWPSGVIDHIDNNRANNAINNLRNVTQSTNILNSSVSVKNTTKIKGVSYNKLNNNYKVRIMIKGKTIRKTFGTLEEASKCAFSIYSTTL